ncbi:Beta-glucosidase 1B [Exophiala dermatitidis]|uniref:Beta-glucosidase n=1 Tax=Exophiala dermatitidis (strain ATCC 34100 / CBS 525.76 / NIH/UT8656) TaxID=858893 RepID=H6BQT1_EXODN|nr:beta-glucosidase [Exophiala dermatitidis NIH/UT8656]EHY54620.1 beta-glucosidase [Exophiala dermatitidis NIH/UT8656]
MALPSSMLFGLLTFANALQHYILTSGPGARPQCSATVSYSEPTYTFGSFAYSLSETVRSATSVPRPTATTTYAPPATSLTSLIPSISYTTWGSWDPTATATASDTDNPYGNAAWTALWKHANPPNFTQTGLYSTTVSPTPVPSSELILPPQDYFTATDSYNFPSGFMFGVAGSAAQIEGATADEGKAPSLLDIVIPDPMVKDYTTNENYYLYKQDIERLAAIGVKYYSFSIPWTRILPFALPGTPVNQQGLQHYSDLIDFVLEKGMLPVVTLVHFDVPLQIYGPNVTDAFSPPLFGYINGGVQSDLFVDAYVNYAKIVMAHFADRVPIWFTFNEPLLFSANGKGIYNLLQAHAQVYHFYKDTIHATGNVSIKLIDNFGVPRDPSNPADVYAADHYNSFQLDTFANPILLGIDYPDSFKQSVPDHVPLTAKDLAYIKGTADFIGLDVYTATVVSPPVPNSIDSIRQCASNASNPLFASYCVLPSTLTTQGWNIGYRSQTYVYNTPTYARFYLSYVYNTFRVPILITEFGFPVFGEAAKEQLSDQLFDSPRSNYNLALLSEVLKSIWEDGVHILGAFAWSFIDNWEYGSFDAHFGLQTVNRTTQERRYKKSFFDLVDFINARTVPSCGK